MHLRTKLIIHLKILHLMGSSFKNENKYNCSGFKSPHFCTENHICVKWKNGNNISKSPRRHLCRCIQTILPHLCIVFGVLICIEELYYLCTLFIIPNEHSGLETLREIASALYLSQDIELFHLFGFTD